MRSVIFLLVVLVASVSADHRPAVKTQKSAQVSWLCDAGNFNASVTSLLITGDLKTSFDIQADRKLAENFYPLAVFEIKHYGAAKKHGVVLRSVFEHLPDCDFSAKTPLVTCTYEREALHGQPMFVPGGSGKIEYNFFLYHKLGNSTGRGFSMIECDFVAKM
jgi:hypothetical protein